MQLAVCHWEVCVGTVSCARHRITCSNTPHPITDINNVAQDCCGGKRIIQMGPALYNTFLNFFSMYCFMAAVASPMFFLPGPIFRLAALDIQGSAALLALLRWTRKAEQT